MLSSGYRWERPVIFDRISMLIRTRGLFVEQPELVAAAVERYGEGGPELGDLLLAGSARRAGALPVLTFDRRLAREPDVRLLTTAR